MARLRRMHWLGGVALFLALLGLAEAYLRVFPPPDLHPYLGDDSPEKGPWAPADDFGVAYRDWDTFCADNPTALVTKRAYLFPSAAAPATWLVLGSSFGFELCHRIPAVWPGQSALTLERREILPVRLAQIKALLEYGARPQRILLVVTPIDFLPLGQHGLKQIYVNTNGGLTYRPRHPPGALGGITRQSRLAFTAWSRLGLQKSHSRFRTKQLTTRVPTELAKDIDHLLRGLADLQRQHTDVPITVVLVPMKRQILLGEGFALEDFMLAKLAELGLDAFHPRQAFLACPRREELFVPDGHLSETGNRLLLRELGRHWRI